MSEEQVSKWRKGWSKFVKNKKPRTERRKANVERRAKEAAERRERERMRRQGELEDKKLKEMDQIFPYNKCLIRRFGITEEQYNKLLAKQKECCAICGRHQSNFKNRLHIDHDHKTGIIRGLLCAGCNTGLGVYEKRKRQFEIYLQIAKEQGIRPKF